MVLVVRHAWSSLLVVVSVLVSGCGAKPGAAGGPLDEPSASAAAEDRDLEAGKRRPPSTHTEFFNEEGNVFIGARGISQMCGGLAEHGIAGYDGASWTWEVPRTYRDGVELVIMNLTLTVGSNAYGQLEALLYTPDGEEGGRAYFAGLGGINETISLEAPILTGAYRVEVRVCGPDTTYRVHGEANYLEPKDPATP